MRGLNEGVMAHTYHCSEPWERIDSIRNWQKKRSDGDSMNREELAEALEISFFPGRIIGRTWDEITRFL